MTSTRDKYFSLFFNNTDRENSTSNVLQFDKSFNPISDLGPLNNYDLFMNSLIITNAELPYRNFYHNIDWDPANFTNNMTNLTFTLYDNNSSGTYNFDLSTNASPLFVGIDADPANPAHYKGVLCYVLYWSENSSLPNPGEAGFTSSQNYPRNYFNLHSLQHFCDLINETILIALDFHINANVKLAPLYFYYDAQTMLYNITMGDAIFTATVGINIDFYVNSFLEHYLDGFRWKFIQQTKISSVGYTGMNYKLVKALNQTNKYTTPFNYWLFTAEYSTINNLSDVISIVIKCNGSLQNTVPQIFANFSVNNALTSNLTEDRILKVLDFVFDSSAQLNNSVIQYENIVSDKPINFISPEKLTDIRIYFYILNSSYEMYPIYLNSDGVCKLSFTIRNKE